MDRNKTCMIFLWVMLLMGGSSCRTDRVVPVRLLNLAQDAVTEYEVVKPDQCTEVDEYAAAVLTNFLFQKTGAVFPVTVPDKLSAGRRHIFLGISTPVRQMLGNEPLVSLKEQEYIVKSAGADILLYGKGVHGNFYAVCDFMENTLGRRWYVESSFVENSRNWERRDSLPVFIVERNLCVSPFSRKGTFSFAYRLPSYEKIFHYQHCLNMGFSERSARAKAKYPQDQFPPGVVSLKFMPVGCHTLFGYIPPTAEGQPWKDVFGWVTKKDYFKTNPEYFTLNKAGMRVADQLCFSNADLRKELTGKILEHIGLLKSQVRNDIIIHVSTMDNPGEFCFCPGCQGLKKKYQSQGGPLYEYLFELCQIVKAKYPDVMIHTLAYRLSQTQKPPVMPVGLTFPDNLTVQFADVEDNVDADFNSPVNSSSYEDLLAWRKLTPHLWTWYYPNSYADGGRMPRGNIERLVTDARLMKKAGVEGVGYEFTSPDTWSGHNFTELQKYLYVKLLKDINSNVPALIREFTDYQYGVVAPMVRSYLAELEDMQRESSHDKSLGAGKGIGRIMTGLNDRRLLRWQGCFDRMEKAIAADARCLGNVRRLRHTLDYATLAGWNGLSKKYPAYFRDCMVVKNRLGAIPRWDMAAVEDWELAIKTAGIEKPLPVEFAGIDKSRLSRLVPVRGRGAPKMLMDADAAFGYGAVVNLPDKPFTFGFYQNDTRTDGPRCRLESVDTCPGSYRLYHLGEVTVTPDCIIWFSSRSWETKLQLGERLYRPPAPGNDNRYDVHVSLKFDKPIDPAPAELVQNDRWSLDTNAPYSVMCDQIIFVKKAAKQ